METADIIIAVVGVVALTATTLGVVFYEELSGEQDIEFDSFSRSLGSVTGQAINGPTNFQFTAGDNATAATFEITVSWTGQSLNGGNAAISVQVTDPNGTVMNEQFSLAVGQNQQGGSGTYTVTVPEFFMTPGHAHTTDADSFNATQMWDMGYTVRLSVTDPSDGPVPGPVAGQVANYSWTADVSGSETYFMHRIAIEDAENV